MLKIEHLTKQFGDFKAVDDLSLEVKSGQICAFIGHNGAGKTTTLKSIAGIIPFDGGEIYVDGESVKKNPIKTKMDIGYLPDDPALYEHLTAIDYLNFVADIYGISAKDRQERIESYAKRLNIYGELGNIISTFSHGMKQKIALISVFLHKPKLYLFDEPFVGLDPISSHELKVMMNEECERGAAFFYSTHVLEVAEKVCTHVAIIKHGKLVGYGEMGKVKGSKDLEKIFMELENENV